MTLLDARGNPIDSMTFARPKSTDVKAPKSGPVFGQWAGRDETFMSLPGGGVLQFDLSRLTMADYRAMRQHYQLGASLNVLTFVTHQIEWYVECKNQKIADFLTNEIMEHWTPLIRGLGQSFWAGYSPLAINYKNGADGAIHLDRIKDLVPEECRVNWKRIDGWAPEGKPKPHIYSYDGMYQANSFIPAENTLWYPLLMENGDHSGRKLLKPAFPPWFFSQLIHLFANRYFERFGEPLPVGRARFDDEVDMGNGTVTSGRKAMETAISAIRSRAVAILPSDRDPVTKEYDYDIEYLESQMRGADFERYLTRLDEEMSLSLFTPVLLFRTADVGSYNLGQAHLRIFQQMLNALSGDLQFYIQNYLVDRLRVLNFGQDSPPAKWVYRKQEQGEIDTYKMLMSELVRSGRAEPDLEELGAIVGLKWDKIEQIVEPPPEPAVDPNTDPNAEQPTSKAARAVASEAAVRIAREYANGNATPALGYRNRIQTALVDAGYGTTRAQEFTASMFAKVNTWLADAAVVTESADELRAMTERILDHEFASL